MTTPVDSEPPPPKRGRPTKAERLKARLSLRDDALNIPNLLTFGRILVIPIVLLLLDRGTPEDCLLAALVYSAAALTDLIDGWLARKLNIVSMLGKFLDPLADKLLVMAVLVYMVPMGRMPEWAVVLLLAREISVTGLRGIASSEGVVIAAGDDGKTKTALQRRSTSSPPRRRPAAR
jgi:CDP-diacylglycerol--glycerol-3-phosphate 3-phosphatidyltransferase